MKHSTEENGGGFGVLHFGNICKMLAFRHHVSSCAVGLSQYVFVWIDRHKHLHLYVYIQMHTHTHVYIIVPFLNFLFLFSPFPRLSPIHSLLTFPLPYLFLPLLSFHKQAGDKSFLFSRGGFASLKVLSTLNEYGKICTFISGS